MRNGYYERDSGIGDFKGQDSGNNHLNEPRAGKSVDANSEKSRSLASHAVVFRRSRFTFSHTARK